MPEMPDILVYLDALRPRVVGVPLRRLTMLNPFVLRTVDPPPAEFTDRMITGVSRIGKRIVLEAEGELFIVIHLMIAGRLRWLPLGKVPPKKLALAAMTFDAGTLILTEAGTTRRASIALVRGREALHAIDRGGVNVLTASFDEFDTRLRSENHTLKRALTDPRLFDGIGNAYSDEILHRARLSPVTLTQRLTPEASRQLYDATRVVIPEWTERLRAAAGDGFPERVTAFHEEMAVHGKFGKPCPVCGTPVQRIRYATNETNYCARCQTGGRLLADRALSRLLKEDWPRTLDALEES